MAWHGIEGHDHVVEQFLRAIQRGRLASSFLFAGPAGVGKRTFAFRLAQALLCESRPTEELDPCQTCPTCQQIAAGNHPDVLSVSKPADKSFLPLALLIGDAEHRGSEGLCHDISLRPYSGKRKVAIIDDADHLNAEGANALLKTLEEPPPKSILILVGTSPAKQLPTIRSRCQLVRFSRLPSETVAALLQREKLVEDPQRAREIAHHSGGSLARAVELADPDLWAFRGTLFSRLAEPDFDSVDLAKTIASFVDAAGKAAPARRARLRQVVRFATHFYRQSLRSSCRSIDAPPSGDPTSFIGHAADDGSSGGYGTIFRLERCLEAAEQIDRNANQTTLIECWLNDLC